MFRAGQLGRFGAGLLALSAAFGLTGCSGLRGGGRVGADQLPGMMSTAPTVGAGEARALAIRIRSLAPSVREGEAERVATCAYECSRELARQYRVVRPAWFHNVLVNLGVRKRGLCYQWAEDLLARLQTLHLRTLQLHWGMARAGTVREHNCVVVTARGQPFEQGIVLDAWRHSGRLVWKPVSADKYPWVEGELGPPP